MSQRPPISPRSPRAALEPEQVPQPPRRSDRVRNPFVVAGNAIITGLLLLIIAAGGIYVYGKQVLSAKGPLTADKVVNIPQRAGMADIGEILQREGVITVAAGLRCRHVMDAYPQWRERRAPHRAFRRLRPDLPDRLRDSAW